MMDSTTQLISLAVAIVSLIAAVIGIIKKCMKKKKPGGGKMENNTNPVTNTKVNGSISQVSDSHSVTIGGNVSIGSILHANNDDLPQKAQKETVDPSSTEPVAVILQDVYTSLFAENGEVHSEQIKIQNLGNGHIEGTVYLDGENTYSLSGTFNNRILTGEFTSIGQFTDERGTINLKQISADILSGFCSFSKLSAVEDQIRMSPYVWVAGSNTNLINGTYEFCTECHREGKKCCCASLDIDMPVLIDKEARRLQSRNPRNLRMRDFSKNIGNTSVRQMLSKKNSQLQSYCHFYDPAENECKIYNIRPTDCRLFPFDIKLDPNTNEYWIGYYDEICERHLPDVETMKMYAHVLRPQLFLLFPYANTINLSEVCQRLGKAHFEKLYKLEQFIF